MKAMIFAAGLGTRLKPITDTLPKALVPVCGQPLIGHVARKLMDSGIDEAVVNVHHFADKIEDWIAEQDWICTNVQDKVPGKMLMQVSDERKALLETGGAVLSSFIMWISFRTVTFLGFSRRCVKMRWEPFL